MVVERIKATIKNEGPGPGKTNAPQAYYEKNIKNCFSIDPLPFS